MNARPALVLMPAVLLLANAACRPSTGPLPVCPASVGSARADEADTRYLSYTSWFQQLVPAIRLPDLVPPADARDCSSRPIAITWPDSAAAERDSRSRAVLLPPRPLTEKDLTVAEGPDGSLLVWARIAFYADGTARGPVALVRFTVRGLEFRGIGTLWAPERRARLRLEPLGEDDHVLVASAELCPPAANSRTRKRCHREVHLLPLVEQYFVQAEVFEDGVPVGPARFASYEQSSVPQKDGSLRRSTVKRSLAFKPKGITLAERVSIEKCDLRTGDEDCIHDEGTNNTRTLTWKDRRFTTTTDTWKRAIAQ